MTRDEEALVLMLCRGLIEVEEGDDGQLRVRPTRQAVEHWRGRGGTVPAQAGALRTTTQAPVAPEVFMLAERFVYDVLGGLNRPLVAPQRDALIQRTARAITQAMDHELDAIRADLERWPCR